MEESVSVMATAAGAARRAKKAASKRAMATATAMATNSVGAPGSSSNGMQRNSSSTTAAAASSESAGLGARTNGGGGGNSVSAAFAPNVSRMRNFGRLKSFSSRQRTMPAMQKAARSGGTGGPAVASAARNAQSSRWTQRNTTTTASQDVHVDLSADAERVAVTNRQQRQDEEETKENLSIASMPPPERQHQEIQQVSAAFDWNYSPSASSNSSSSSGMMQSRQPQRMRCLKLKCAAHPDLVMPYLYGDRKSRINSIMQETGCTIDYCPMSPDEEAQSPQSRAYIMNFLISAESAENLEEAIRMLRALVEKVETHLQKKMRIRSLHAASAYRQLEIDQPGTQYSQESHDRLVYSGEFDAEYVKVESNRSADRMEQETEQYSARPRHPISPVSLETPIDSFRQHNSPARRRDRIDRSVEQERGARMAVQYDDDIAYYDKWGRPVYRQELGVDGEEYDAESDDNAVRQVSDVPSRQQVSRLLQRRRWQHVDESDWSRHHRSFVHVSPAGEDRVTSPPGSAHRRKASIHRRYVPYHHSDVFGDDEYEEVYRARRPSREAARVSTFHAEERYSDFENDLLEHEEDVLAAQEFSIKSRAQLSYGSRRGVKRSPGQFREVSPPPFQHKRATRPTSNTHYPYELFDGQTGEWLSDDEDLDIVYRRHPRQPAVLYPHMHMSYQAARVPRGRRNSFSAPTAHSRSAQPDSPREEMPKRRKSSVVSQNEDFLRNEHPRVQVPGSILTSRDEHACDSSASAAHGAQLEDGECWILRADENMVRSVHFDVPENVTAEEELQQLAHLEKGLPSSQTEQVVRDTVDVSAVYERRDEFHDSGGTAADGLTKTTLNEDDLMAGEQIEGKSQQLQGCEVDSSLGENVADFADSNTSGTSEPPNEEATDQVRVPDGLVSTGLSFSIPTTVHEDVKRVNSLAEQPRHVSTSLSLTSKLAFEKDRVGEHAKNKMMFAEDESVAATQPRSNSWRVRANELLVASLRKDTCFEIERAQVQHDVKSHLKKYLAFEESSKLLAQLDELSTTAHDLQCQVVSASCKLSTSARRQMLDMLDDAVQDATRSDKSTQEKISLLTAGIKKALSLCGVDLSLETPARVTFAAETLAQSIVQSPEIAPNTTIAYESPTFDDNDNNWEHADGWFENTDDHYEMEVFEEEEAVVPEANPAHETSSSNRDAPLVPKKEEIALLSPTENQSYASNLFGEASLCSPTSFVMKGMQKRLFGEIERANVYYYLHPVKLPDADSAKPRSICEFGCSSGSAGGWVQKVTSQISSRMKWFDEVTYSLARARSGGAEAGSELLNRKKMNSTIRKLHLMAIQLHCLVSHLYCVRGCSECKEIDSLAAALNSSYFEKRMTAYKSRLKLEADLHGTPDELLRDTFEFFPEFLLCIEMWGYDYREGTGSSSEVNKIRKSVKTLPIQLFSHVESAVFDYEFDKNGFLQTVCEELLSIVCLWNDFVWGDNLETLPVERITVFESEMKKNVAKILQTFSLHLMGSWAIRLLDNPDELQGLRFTQQNAYYAESSKMRGLASSNQSGGKFPGSWEEIGRCDDEEEAVKHYWKLKTDACGLENAVEKRAGELPSSLISIDAVEKWGKEKTTAHLLKWSRVFELRGELETCGVVLSDLLKDVMTDASVDGDADPANLVATELLRIVGKSRVVGADLAAMSEMMALHSASFQLPQEMKSREASEVQKEPISEPAEEVGGVKELDGVSECAVDDEKPTASSQSDVKDLIQILASTRKEVEEIFCARTRSGRMRDKLQSQSVQLAQQTIDLFQNISTMRTE